MIIENSVVTDAQFWACPNHSCNAFLARITIDYFRDEWIIQKMGLISAYFSAGN